MAFMVVRNGPASFCGAGGITPMKAEDSWELVSRKGHYYDPTPGEIEATWTQSILWNVYIYYNDQLQLTYMY